ncbi:MAG: nitroreductase family protein [Pseudobacteriovorax sp.]|nr:nitroreductase family protein [Pseudobacteriovorax sp.]
MSPYEKFIPYNAERLDNPEKRAKEFYQRMNQRRSVRKFSDEDVPRSVIEHAILTAGTAPNGAHMQPWHFVAVRSKDLKSQIRVAAEQEESLNYNGRLPPSWLKALERLGTDENKGYLEVAPWLIIVFAKMFHWEEGGDVPAHDNDPKVNHYYVQESVGIAVGMLISALHNAGLATLTHTPSPMRFLHKILGRHANEKPFVLLPVGYPAADAKVPNITRDPIEKVSTFFDG